MLDHLGNVRLRAGVGRGFSPFEVGFYGVNPAEAQAMYIETFAVLMQVLMQVLTGAWLTTSMS